MSQRSGNLGAGPGPISSASRPKCLEEHLIFIVTCSTSTDPVRARTSGPARFSPTGLLAAFLASVFGVLAAAQPPSLDLETVVTGLESPTAIAHAGDDRLFITERGGRVRILREDGLVAEAFLDLRDRVWAEGERGLLGLAFHPDFPVNGWFFVHYTDVDGDTVLSRFSASGDDPDRADPGSERVLLQAEQPFPNHNGGQLAFGADGYLYLALGDGGSRFDPMCNALDRGTLLGSILRLDVDNGSGAPPYHSLPPDNPFVGEAGARGEIWAYGLRNPWRFSFDRANGDLYIADVGETQREEVNFQRYGEAGGRSYGWKVWEGTVCRDRTAGCLGSPPGCDSAAHTGPVLEYAHVAGRCAITGGHVYRGSAVPDLVGWYFYGDFCTGEILLTRRRVETPWVQVNTGLKVAHLATFGEDRDGEIYAAGLSGTLYRFVAAEPEPFECQPDDTTLCLGEGGRFQVRATFFGQNGVVRSARAERLTDDTGYFWFFRAGNVEIVAKVLDGCPVNDRFWVFAGGLTDVGGELVVTDSSTGHRKTYPNTSRTPFAPIQDTAAFNTCD